MRQTARILATIALAAHATAAASAGPRDTAPPFGGEILRDAEGEPTGMLIDRAMGLFGIRNRPSRLRRP